MTQMTPSRASLIVVAMLCIGTVTGSPRTGYASSVTEAPDGGRDVDGDPETYDNGGPGRLPNNAGLTSPMVSRTDTDRMSPWKLFVVWLGSALVALGPGR